MNRKKTREQLFILLFPVKTVINNQKFIFIMENEKKKILVVEDEKTLRFLIVQTLKGEGFDVEEAIDGEEGLKKIKDNKPDLILLDLLLPGINGFDFLSRIKKDSNTESIPVIIFSNLGQEEEIQRGIKLGAVDYLIKAHFTLNEVVVIVRKILNS